MNAKEMVSLRLEIAKAEVNLLIWMKQIMEEAKE